MAKIKEILLVVGQNTETNNIPNAVTNNSANTTASTSSAVVPALIETPAIIAPVNGETDFIGTIKSSEYKTSEYFYGEHQASDWEITTDSSFSTVDISSYNDTGNLTSFQLADITALTTYYVRVRYRSDNHTSEWSNPIKFTTPDVYVKTPDITIQGEPSNVSEMPIITGSEFKVIGDKDEHQYTDWVIRDINGDIVWSSLQDNINLTSIRVPNNVLKTSTTYLFEVTYYGNKYVSPTRRKTVTTADVFGSVFDIFGDGSSIALFELNGNANDTGGVYNAEEHDVTYSDGVLGLAVDYRNKTNKSYIKAPVINRNGKKEITISCWLNIEKDIKQWIVVLRIDPGDTSSINGNSRQPAIFINRYDNSKLYIRNDGVKRADLGFTSKKQLEYGKWHHIVLIVTLRQMKLYIDNEISDVYDSNQDFKFNDGVFYIGDRWYRKNFLIDQVRIFNRALTEAEVEILYNEGM